MSNTKQKEDTLRRVLLAIARGYSSIEYESETIFIKHFTIFDQEELDEAYDRKLKKLLKQGIPSEEKYLKELEEQGKWGPDHEKKIRDKRAYVDNLTKTKNSLVIPSQIDQLKGKIEVAKKEVDELEAEKAALLSNTAESFSSRYLNDESIFNSFFSSKSLDSHFFSKEEFDELERKEIYSLIKLYNSALEIISIDNIKQLALSGLFVNYFNVSEEAPHEVFDRKPLNLTFYQLNLITYCKIFKSIFKNIPEIPEEMRDKPDELLEFAESGHKAKQKIEQLKRQAQKGKGDRAQSIVGASKEDMQKMGFDTENTMTPGDFLKKKGKTSFSLLEDGDFNV